MRRKPGPKPRRPAAEDLSDPRAMRPLLLGYLERLRVGNFSDETIRNVRQNAGYFIAWAAERGVTRATEVTLPVLERYQRWLYHYRNAVTGRPLSFRSQHARLSAVRGFFRHLARDHVILYDPAAALELPRVEKRLPRNVLTVSEVEQLLSSPDVEDPLGLRDRAILEVLYSTGMRRMELCNLELPDVDFERETVMIRRGKGRKDRMVPIGERALLWLGKYLREVRPGFVVEPDPGRIFLTNYGEPMSPKRLTQIVTDHVKRSGIGKAGSCHMLRHTMATLMLERGADIRFIQEILGHAELNSTEVYTKVSIQKLKDVHTRTHPGAELRGENVNRANGAGDDRDDDPRDVLVSTLDAEAEEETDDVAIDT